MIKQLFLLLFLLQFQIISYAVECESYVKTCSNPGAETTVFIDLNSKTEGTNREINCARKAACEGKQNMIVFPGSDASINPNNIAAKFKEFVRKLDKEKVNMSKMVLSGHDGGSNYGGLRGALSFNEIDAAFLDDEKKDLPIKSKVKSLYGWGCYTATINEVDKKWLKSFPNLDYMLGYDLKAPLSDKRAGYEFLYEAMSAEAKINEAKTVKDFSNSLNKLEWANTLNLAAFHKTCENSEDPSDDGSSGADGFYLSKTYGDMTLKEAKEACKIKRLQVQAELTIFNEYLYGDKKIPSHGPEGAGNSLRAFYEKLRSTEACATGLAADKALPLPDHVIMLIYDDNLMSNFFSLYATDLVALKALLEKAYPGKDLSSLVPSKNDLKDPLYRKKFADNIFQLNQQISGLVGNETPLDKKTKLKSFYGTATAEQKQASNAVDNLNSMLFNLNVPIEWRDDPHSTRKDQPLIPVEARHGDKVVPPENETAPQGEHDILRSTGR